MSKGDNTYQNSKVGQRQGAEAFFIDSDGNFEFFGTNITGQEMYDRLVQVSTQLNATVIANSAGAGSGVLSTTYVPSQHGLVIYSIGDGASNASAWITSCLQGQRLILMTRGIGSTGSIKFSMLTGVSVIGLYSGALSTIDIGNSANSVGYVELVATADDTWAVVDFRGNVTLNTAS